MFEIISAVVISSIVQLLKKIRLSTRLAPIAVIVLVALLIILTKTTVSLFEAILKVLSISGISVLGYDILKKTILNKK